MEEELSVLSYKKSGLLGARANSFSNIESDFIIDLLKKFPLGSEITFSHFGFTYESIVYDIKSKHFNNDEIKSLTNLKSLICFGLFKLGVPVINENIDEEECSYIKRFKDELGSGQYSGKINREKLIQLLDKSGIVTWEIETEENTAKALNSALRDQKTPFIAWTTIKKIDCAEGEFNWKVLNKKLLKPSKNIVLKGMSTQSIISELIDQPLIQLTDKEERTSTQDLLKDIAFNNDWKGNSWLGVPFDDCYGRNISLDLFTSDTGFNVLCVAENKKQAKKISNRIQKSYRCTSIKISVEVIKGSINKIFIRPIQEASKNNPYDASYLIFDWLQAITGVYFYNNKERYKIIRETLYKLFKDDSKEITWEKVVLTLSEHKNLDEFISKLKMFSENGKYGPVWEAEIDLVENLDCKSKSIDERSDRYLIKINKNLDKFALNAAYLTALYFSSAKIVEYPNNLRKLIILEDAVDYIIDTEASWYAYESFVRYTRKYAGSAINLISRGGIEPKTNLEEIVFCNSRHLLISSTIKLLKNDINNKIEKKRSELICKLASDFDGKESDDIYLYLESPRIKDNKIHALEHGLLMNI